MLPNNDGLGIDYPDFSPNIDAFCQNVQYDAKNDPFPDYPLNYQYGINDQGPNLNLNNFGTSVNTMTQSNSPNQNNNCSNLSTNNISNLCNNSNNPMNNSINNPNNMNNNVMNNNMNNNMMNNMNNNMNNNMGNNMGNNMINHGMNNNMSNNMNNNVMNNNMNNNGNNMMNMNSMTMNNATNMNNIPMNNMNGMNNMTNMNNNNRNLNGPNGVNMMNNAPNNGSTIGINNNVNNQVPIPSNTIHSMSNISNINMGPHTTPFVGGSNHSNSGIRHTTKSTRRRRTASSHLSHEDILVSRVLKNRENAREFRKRKKEFISNLDRRVKELEIENSQLKKRIEINKEKIVIEENEKWNITFQLRDLIASNAPEETFVNTLTLLTDKYSDYGKDKTNNLFQHFHEVERLCLPTQVSKMVIWGLSQSDDFYKDDVDDQVGLSTGGTLWGLISSCIDMAPEQKERLLQLREKISPVQRQLSEIKELLSDLEGMLRSKNDSLYEIFDEIQKICTPVQCVKFILWLTDNPACVQMLNKLWPTSFKLNDLPCTPVAPKK